MTAQRRPFFLMHDQARNNAARYCMEAPAGWMVVFSEPKRSNLQNAMFHAIVGDIAKSGLKWCGKTRTASQWKVLLVSGHSAATNEGSEMVPGLEGEFVNLRESTALMSKKRGASLIEYALAFCAMNDIRLSPESRDESAANK
jgi:hypothetical protein